MTVVPALASYYEANGSWAGAEELLTWAEQGRLDDTPEIDPNESDPIGPATDNRGDGQQAERRFAVLTLTDGGGKALYTVPDGEQVRQFNAIGKLPINVQGETVGWLLFRFAPLPNGSPENEFLQRTSRVILLGVGLATVMALVLGLVLARTLSQPIRALTEATRAMAHGALGTQVDIRSKDELGELGTAFNQMSTDLARSLQLRRQMTADIAHDLRTPLSVILGYTEALNDGKFVGDPVHLCHSARRGAAP